MATAASTSNNSTWLPEDDVLLKNAMQEGACFEALVKGVVPFSRKFTFQELQDRWHSLLYDPDIAAQASVNMFQLELSGFNCVFKNEQPKGLHFKETIGKRNRRSLRKHYNTMRKKFRREFLNPPDFSLLEEAGLRDRKEESRGEECMITNGVQDHLKILQEGDMEILHHGFSKHRNVSATEAHNSYITECSKKAEQRSLNELIRKDGFIDDVSTSLNKVVRNFEPNMKPSGVEFESKHFQRSNLQPLSGFGSRKEDCSNGFLGLHQVDSLSSPNGNSFHVLGFPSPNPTLPLWEPVEEFSVAQLPEKLKHVDAAPGSRDCTVKDSLIYDVVPTGPSNNGPTHLSNTSVVVEGEDISDSLLNLSNEEDLMLLDVDKKELFQKSSSLLTNDISKDCAFKLENEITVSENITVDHTTATSKRIDEFQNLYDGKICCVLNTEDLEIPCNDDIFLLIHPSTSCVSSADPPQHISRDFVDISSTVKQKQKAKGVNLVTKGKGIAKESIMWPQKDVPTVMPEVHSVKPVRFGVKSDCRDTGALALPPLPGVAKPPFPGPAKSRSLLTNPIISTGRVLNEGLPRVESKAGDNLAVKKPFPDPVVIPSTSDHEESESDDDVPYYSDIEAMILEMDLVPFDLDITTTKQVTKYQDESSNSTIVRLEQSSQACLERTMSRQGAFAILYGRRSRHYIKKTEVLLGRSTDEIHVDIDLSIEGRANKISRRQAIIKMDGGSFFLKNLGKGVIYVNGKCIATGQVLGLTSSCLIEIKEMSFVFEINHKYVDQYINALSQKNQRKQV